MMFYFVLCSRDQHDQETAIDIEPAGHVSKTRALETTHKHEAFARARCVTIQN